MSRLHAIGFAAVAILTVAGPAKASEPVADFKDWAVVCDNLHNCVADGFGAEDADRPAILRLTRGGAANAALEAEIQVLTVEDGEVLAGKPLVVDIDGRALATIKVGEPLWARLADAQVGPLLAAARNGTTLTISLEGRPVGVVSLAGMVAALRLVDDQQARVGTVTALVAKGARPASAVPPPPSAPVVRKAPAVAQTGLPAKPPAGVKALATKAECDVEQDGVGEPEVHRLSADQVLWRMPCGAGAYNFTSLFVVTDNKGGGARLAPIDGADDGMAVNAQYDPKTRLLSAYNKGRGVGDCGDSNEWAWTGQAFVLTHEATMSVCRGQADWPTSYQAKVE